jgi:acetate---CoA ligase (ADP-forming)
VNPVRQLFRFSGVAIVGATPRNSFAVQVLDGLKSVGFAGKVACINPKAEPVRDVAGYATLAEVPFALDAAVIVVRADRVPALLVECGEHGVRGVTIISGGFLESGAAGAALQAEVVSLAERYGIAVCGPNCLGFVSLHDRTSSYSRANLPQTAGSVAVISHSGGMLNEVLNYGGYRGIGFSSLISSGNEAVCTVADYVDYLVDDERTSTIGLIVEGMRSSERVRAAFDRAARARKPIVAIKLGTSALAAAATATHTGAIAGSADLFVAMAEQYGVTIVEDLEELCESLLLFSQARRLIVQPAVRGLAAIEVSGGGKNLICDLAARRSLDLPLLGAATAERIAPILGDLSTPSNPVDLASSWDIPSSLGQHDAILDALAADGGYDVVASRVTVLPKGTIESALAHGDIVARAAGRHPAMLFTVLGRASDAINLVWQRFCAENGVTYLQGYRRGIGALANLDAYRRFLALDRGTPAQLPALAALPDAGELLDEVAAKDVLRALGLPVNATRFAATAGEAVAAAEAIGFPVVVKGISPYATHKSDLGLVALGLRTADEVRGAAERMLAALSALGSGGGRTGISVQRQVEPGLEVIVGAYRDALYGPVVLCALGGIFAEAFDERILRLAPVTAAEAQRAIDGSKIGRLARGYRHIPASGTASLAQLLATLSAWVARDERVAELDANPVILRGDAIDIVDARIVLRPAGG